MTTFEELRGDHDHLRLIVGSNPLPNYVAARLLAREGTTVSGWCEAALRELVEKTDLKLEELRGRLREIEALRWRKGSKGRVTKGEEGRNHMHARQGIGFWIADGGLWI